MCTKVAASESARHGSYGDIEAGIDGVALVDIPPGMVLRITPREANGWGPTGTQGVNGFGTWPRQAQGGKGQRPRPLARAPQPRTEMVHYTKLDADNVVVKIHASALNYPDLTMLTHVYQTRPDPPFCLGFEGAGEVVRVCGDEASYDGGRGRFAPPRVGDRVFVSTRMNTHATRVAVPAANCTPIPGSFDYDDAAGYVQGVSSSYEVLVSRLQVKRGEWCAITGATGAIGLAAVQICAQLGVRVIALGSDARGSGRLDVVRRMGADHVIDYVKHPRWRDIVKRLTGGRGADCLYDIVGGDSFTECVHAAARGGRLCVNGFVSGSYGQLPLNLVLVKGLYVCAMTSQFPANPDAVRNKRERMLGWARDGTLRPHISHRFPLTRIREALRTMNERRHVGRIIVRPQEF